MLRFSGIIGRSVIARLNFYGGMMALIFYSFLRLFNPRIKGKYYFKNILIQQIYFTGWQALKIIILIALIVGGVMIAQLNQFLMGYGQGKLLGSLQVTLILKHLAPILTAIIIIARSGTAIATELGNMIEKHEVEALETLGVDTIYFLVLPRILGMTIAIFILNIFFIFFSVLCSFVVASLLYDNISFHNLVEIFFNQLSYMNLLETVLKTIFSGVGIAVICIINGFKATSFKGGVPVAGINAVVGSLSYMFLIHLILTFIFVL